MFQDLPEQIRHRFEDALGKGKEEVIIKEEITTVHDLSRSEKEDKVTASLETVLTLLSKMKNSLEGGNIGHREYNRMAFNIIKDYMTTLPEDMHLNFVMNEISNSEFSDYINDDTLKDLRAFVLSSKS